jgi:hypothetical protein
MTEPIRILTVERDSDQSLIVVPRTLNIPDMGEAQNMQIDTTGASAQSAEALKAIVLHSWNWPLSVPRGVNAQLMLTGQFTKGDIARLKKQIEFLEDSFDDDTKEAAQ